MSPCTAEAVLGTEPRVLGMSGGNSCNEAAIPHPHPRPLFYGIHLFSIRCNCRRICSIRNNSTQVKHTEAVFLLWFSMIWKVGPTFGSNGFVPWWIDTTGCAADWRCEGRLWSLTRGLPPPICPVNSSWVPSTQGLCIAIISNLFFIISWKN